MTPAEEARFERQVEKEFRSHRELPNGRDFRWNTYRFLDQGGNDIDRFRDNFDETFPDAPGSPGWFEKKFGS